MAPASAWAERGARVVAEKAQAATNVQRRARSRCCRKKEATQHRASKRRAATVAAARRTRATGLPVARGAGLTAAEGARELNDGSLATDRARTGLQGAANVVF